MCAIIFDGDNVPHLPSQDVEVPSLVIRRGGKVIQEFVIPEEELGAFERGQRVYDDGDSQYFTLDRAKFRSEEVVSGTAKKQTYGGYGGYWFPGYGVIQWSLEDDALLDELWDGSILFVGMFERFPCSAGEL